MDTAAVVIAVGGVIVSLFTMIQAGRRARVFFVEWQAAKVEKYPGPQHTVEVQTARDLFVGQAIRIVGYLAIFLIFVSFLTAIFPGFLLPGTRAGRVMLTAVVLIAFNVEENFLVRAKLHWAEMLRELKELRNGGS